MRDKNSKSEWKDNMDNIPTQELDEKLRTLRTDDVAAFTEENSRYLTQGDKAFSYYFKDTVKAKNMFFKDVYIRADMSESYGEKLISQTSHTKNRDKIIALCLAGHFTLDETNRALKLYKMTPLYSKVKRDIVLIVAINNRNYKLSDVDKELIKQGFNPLSKDD